jgi:hypothetical protein
MKLLISAEILINLIIFGYLRMIELLTMLSAMPGGNPILSPGSAS